MAKSNGINIAAACGTVTDKAMIGTANAPKPEPKPDLDKPMRKTAGIAAA
jgi:hypothetical protein